MIKKGYKLRFCNTRNDTDRCISPDGYPSRLETQTAMEKSNYTLCLPGDTAGSDRWSQAMVAGKCQSNTVCTYSFIRRTKNLFYPREIAILGIAFWRMGQFPHFQKVPRVGEITYHITI